jgi:replicative DNA helicase
MHIQRHGIEVLNVAGPRGSKEPGVAEILIAKQRNGPTGTVKLAFLRNITKFESLAHGGGGDF